MFQRDRRAKTLPRPSVGAIAALALLGASGAPAQEAGPDYALSYIPDAQLNLVCLDRADARALLEDFHARLRAAPEDAAAMEVMRTFEPRFGEDRAYDCAFLDSLYVPTVPLEVIDIAAEDGADWGDRAERYFVRSSLLIDGQEFAGAEGGDGIWAFTWDFVIRKY